jgi:hypothetical protein
MQNTYIFISLVCIIFINTFAVHYYLAYRRREGFDIGKAIDRLLGKLVDGLVKGMIGGDIYKAVKKKKGFGKKLETLFSELFLALLTIIFLPLGAIICMVLLYYLFIFIMGKIPVLFKPSPFMTSDFMSFIC